MNKTTTELHPCWYMEHAVQNMAEGKSGGAWMLFAKLHVPRCPQCRAALEALKLYLAEVKSAPNTSGELPSDFWVRLESDLDSVEKKVKPD